MQEKSIIAKILIPENKTSKVKVGQTVEIYPVAFPKEKYNGIKGKLYYLSPQAIKGYIVGKVQLQKDKIKVKTGGKIIEKKISYGMTLSGKIIIGRVSILKYLVGIKDY